MGYVRTFLLALVFLGITSQAQGAVLTVGAGQAYAFIQQALNAAAPGDVVSVREAKAYNEQLTLPTSGTAAARITLRNDSGGAVQVYTSTTLPVLNLGGQDYWTITGLDFHTDATSSGNLASSSGACDYLTLSDCEFSRTYGGGGRNLYLSGGCNHAEIRNNYFNVQNGSVATTVDLPRFNDSLFAGNEITGGELEVMRDGLTVSGQRFVIENNYIHNAHYNHSDGIVIHTEPSGASTGDFIVRGNVIKNWAGNGPIYVDAWWQDFYGTNLIYNNVIYCTPDFGQAMKGIVVAGENLGNANAYLKTPVHIYNNTISVTCYAIHLSRTNGSAGSAIDVRNNAILKPYHYGNGWFAAVYWSSGQSPRLTMDSNFFDASTPTGGQLCYWNGAWKTLAQWQALGYDTHGRTGSARLDESLRPQAGSELIDAGTGLATYFNTDKAGTSRPQGDGWDCGAYEYLQTAQGPPAPTGLVVIPE